jgi:hypothetical protein
MGMTQLPWHTLGTGAIFALKVYYRYRVHLKEKKKKKKKLYDAKDL